MIRFTTSDPAGLLYAFRAGIEKGRIRTWVDDGDEWFSQRGTKWAGKAMLRPAQDEQQLSFRILVIDATPVKDRRAIYAFYQGHLIETFIAHLTSNFTSVTASANPSGNDNAKLG